ncbi:hypothetical protein [Pedobacter steynii]
MIQNNNQGALQQPLNTGFNAQSTTNDVIKGIDLQNKVVIVTGGNAGIGLETTKTLARAGATSYCSCQGCGKSKVESGRY